MEITYGRLVERAAIVIRSEKVERTIGYVDFVQFDDGGYGIAHGEPNSNPNIVTRINKDTHDEARKKYDSRVNEIRRMIQNILRTH